MAILNSNGDGNSRFKYTGTNWELLLKGRAVANFTSGDAYLSGDISAPGGYAQSYTFVCNKLLQNTFREMSASFGFTSGSAGDGVSYTKIPLPRAGSILGWAIHTQDGVIKSGALSASVLVGAATQFSIGMNTGSTGYGTFAKDTYTFAAGSTLGVTITGSSTYLCEPDVTSASFLATILVEM